MKVKELIEYLQELNPEATVLTSKDDEGNGYNKVHYKPEECLFTGEDWEIEIYPNDIEGIMHHMDCSEEDAEEYISQGNPCIVI